MLSYRTFDSGDSLLTVEFLLVKSDLEQAIIAIVVTMKSNVALT